MTSTRGSTEQGYRWRAVGFAAGSARKRRVNSILVELEFPSAEPFDRSKAEVPRSTRLSLPCLPMSRGRSDQAQEAHTLPREVVDSCAGRERLPRGRGRRLNALETTTLQSPIGLVVVVEPEHDRVVWRSRVRGHVFVAPEAAVRTVEGFRIVLCCKGRERFSDTRGVRVETCVAARAREPERGQSRFVCTQSSCAPLVCTSWIRVSSCSPTTSVSATRSPSDVTAINHSRATSESVRHSPSRSSSGPSVPQ